MELGIVDLPLHNAYLLDFGSLNRGQIEAVNIGQLVAVFIDAPLVRVALPNRVGPLLIDLSFHPVIVGLSGFWP